MHTFRIRTDVLVRVTLILTIAFADVASTPLSSQVWARAFIGPRAVVSSTSFNFGEVYRGEIISQLFVIKNVGDTELQIKDFKSDCGCTTIRSPKVIAPGEDGSVELEVQTVSQSGPISKGAILNTNDPDQPVIRLTLVANVVSGASNRPGRYIGPIFLSPEVRGSMYAMPGKKATTEFLVTAGNAPVNLVRVEGGRKYFTSRLEVVEPGRSYKIKIESLPIEDGGLFTDQLRVVTDNQELPAFTLELFLRVYDKQ